jgi:hypothetical protein
MPLDKLVLEASLVHYEEGCKISHDLRDVMDYVMSKGRIKTAEEFIEVLNAYMASKATPDEKKREEFRKKVHALCVEYPEAARYFGLNF